MQLVKPKNNKFREHQKTTMYWKMHKFWDKSSKFGQDGKGAQHLVNQKTICKYCYNMTFLSRNYGNYLKIEVTATTLKLVSA